MSDADSIVVFQNIPATIFYEGFEKFNISKDIEFTVFQILKLCSYYLQF